LFFLANCLVPGLRSLTIDSFQISVGFILGCRRPHFIPDTNLLRRTRLLPLLYIALHPRLTLLYILA
jgi:hypothetical protein